MMSSIADNTNPNQHADRAAAEAQYRTALAQSAVPVHLHDGLALYLAHHIRTGSFLRAVLENDLLSAVRRGDDISVASLPAIVRWLYRYAPARSWCSPENVVAWLTRHLTSEQIATFVENRLPPDERAQAVAHMANCDECRQLAATVANTSIGLSLVKGDARG